MPLLADLSLLAQLPESDVYISWWKLLLVVAWFAIWAAFAAWVDKDAVAVNTYRVLWNLIVLGTGMLAVCLGLLIPNFAISFPVFFVVNLIVMLWYVVHRNALVEPNLKVLTADHFRRIREEGITGKKKKKLSDVKERVRLLSGRKPVPIPEEETEREMYRLTQDLMFDFFWRRASACEIIPSGQATKVTYLIDMIPTDREALPRQDADLIITYLKKLAGLNQEEKRKPQTGRIGAALGESKAEVVIRTDGSTAGEKLTLKLVGGEASFKTADLGFNPDQLKSLNTVMKEIPAGIIILSGPKRSGITTTLYSVVRSNDAFLQNIQMLEYAKEVTVDNVTQHIFVPSEDKKFADELQKLIRTDPDILVIPEVRERETALALSKAATEKQKVFVTLQAADVFEALKKWMSLASDRGVIAKTLLAILNQRLLRRLCTQCKQPYKPDAAMLKKLNMPADKVLYRPPEPTYDKHGNPIICQACQGTGYAGVTGTFEVLVIDDGMRDVIRRAASFEDIQAYAKSKGATGLQAQALQKVLEGETSIQEVVRIMRGGEPPAAGSAAVKPAPKPAPKPAA